eukprot:11261918-Heterocapsa_arctica.AAC.1
MAWPATPDEITDRSLRDHLEAVAPGIYGPSDFSGSEFDLIETPSVSLIDQIIGHDLPQFLEDPKPPPGRYRATFVRSCDSGGARKDLEKTVIISQA